MSKAKGTTLVTLVKFLRSQRERALAALPPPLHAYLDERIHASSWYPEADLLSLMRAMVAMMPGPRDAVLAQMGVALAREHLEGIYGHLKLDAQGDPATLARRSFALWGSQHDTGTFRIDVERPGRALLEVRDYALPSAEMCGILTGYLGESLRLGGAVNVRVAKQACRLDGHEVCSWSAQWDA
ncbi:MAG: hypothetical protein H6Q91_2084 [Deltaproteobacteria bacterium]|nr:hypothetical protein [Deltaproteobacteria bacterium]